MDWSLSLSHEALELVVNPLVNLYVLGPHPDPNAKHDVFHGYEICDAVMEESYLIDRWKVSNFLLPLYFTRDGHNLGRVVFKDRDDKTTKPLTSFGLDPGGYVPFYDPKEDQYFHYHSVKDKDDKYETQLFEAQLMAQYHPWRFEEREAAMVRNTLHSGHERRRRRDAQ
jgi:hypothetical protein